MNINNKKLKFVFCSSFAVIFLLTNVLGPVNAVVYRYVSQIEYAHCIAYGDTAYYTSANWIIGDPDGYCSHLHTETFWGDHQGDEVIITARMNMLAGGRVWIYCHGYTTPGHPPSRIFVMVGNNSDGAWGTWEWLSQGIVVPSSPQWLYIGTTVSSYFQYIAICIWAPDAYYAPNDVYVDAVKAEPFIIGPPY